ncbi:hypothetical protein A2U01_0087860, partial [Trifolium medium]|nr:hypothetical protein [Trifolium medium]
EPKQSFRGSYTLEPLRPSESANIRGSESFRGFTASEPLKDRCYRICTTFRV